MLRFAINKIAASASAERATSLKPVQTARAAWTGWPAPVQNDTRALQAMAMDSGTMYSTEAMLAAIWWLAEAAVPRRAMNSAISVKDVTYTR